MKLRSYPNDQIIMGIIFLLCGFGIVMMYSASSIYAMNKFDNYLHFFMQQVKWLAIGAILMLMLSQVSYRILKKMAYGLLILSWIILVLGYFFKGEFSSVQLVHGSTILFPFFWYRCLLHWVYFSSAFDGAIELCCVPAIVVYIRYII